MNSKVDVKSYAGFEKSHGFVFSFYTPLLLS